MSGYHELFSEGGDNYARFRPTYPEELYEEIISWTSTGKELAVDVATGTGQAAIHLSKYFDRVIAVDRSPEQIAHAPQINNVEFRVVSGEEFAAELGLKEGSVDLITVAAGLHWLDLERFWEQCRRVLKPDGVLAAWAYGIYSFPESETATRALDELLNETHGDYWAQPIQHIRTRYADLKPCKETFGEISTLLHDDTKDLSLRNLLGFISTLSGYKAYRSANPTLKDPLEVFEEKIVAILGLESKDSEIKAVLPVFGIIAKGPIR